MEQATDAVNWRPANPGKRAGRARRRDRAVDRAAARTASCSSSGASPARAARSSTPRCSPTPAPTPRPGGEVTELGARLAALPPLPAPGPRRPVALVFDWENWWAVEERDHPTEIDYLAARCSSGTARCTRAGSWSTSCRPRRSTTATTSRSLRRCTCCATRAPRRSRASSRAAGRCSPGPFTDIVDEPRPVPPRRLPHPARPGARRALRGLRRARRRDAPAAAASARRRAVPRRAGDTVGVPRRRRRRARARSSPRSSTPSAPRSSRPSPTASPPARPALTRNALRRAARPGTSRRCPTPRASTPSSAPWWRHPVSRPSSPDLPAGSRRRAAAISSRSSTTATSRSWIDVDGTDAETGAPIGRRELDPQGVLFALAPAEGVRVRGRRADALAAR